MNDSDITIKCGNNEWKLHKQILSDKSEYFKSLFHFEETSYHELDNEIIDPSLLNLLLQNWYDNTKLLISHKSVSEYVKWKRLCKYLLCNIPEYKGFCNTHVYCINKKFYISGKSISINSYTGIDLIEKVDFNNNEDAIIHFRNHDLNMSIPCYSYCKLNQIINFGLQ